MSIVRLRLFFLPAFVAIPVVGCGSSAVPVDQAPEEVASTSAALSANGFSYHGGPLMTATGAPNKFYYIWYGDWSGNPGAQTILADFANNVGGSPWFNINNLYYDSSNNHIPNAMTLGGTFNDPGSQGTDLRNGTIVLNVVDHAINATGTHLPNDPNGVYVVFAGHGITSQDDCSVCAKHTAGPVNGSTVKFILIPDPTIMCSAAGQCGTGYQSPNNNVAADLMANSLAHEMTESLTDPTAHGWFGSSSATDENGDRCNYQFGTMYTASGCTSACANARLGSRDYLIQMNWLPLGSAVGQCSNRFMRQNDIIWHDSSGDWVVQHGDGASSPAFFLTTTVPTEWVVVGKGDIDGDSNDDWLWRDTRTGDVSLWLMNGPTPISGTTIAPALPLAWQTIGVADFDGDGRKDILWRNTSTGDVVVWFMNGTRILSSVEVKAGLPLVWQSNGTGDFNGDGKGDIVWRNTSTGDVVMWAMNGSTVTLSQTIASGLSLSWQIIGQTGDFDGDGTSDLLWQNTSSKDVGVWLISNVFIKGIGTAMTAFTGYELIGVGDFNGDGQGDVMWRNTSTQDLQTWRMNGTSIAGTFTPLRASNSALVSAGTYADQNR